MKKHTFRFTLIFFVLILAACGNSPLNLTGEWIGEDQDEQVRGLYFSEDKKITLSFGRMQKTYNYSLSDDQKTLNILDDDGDVQYTFDVIIDDKDNITLKDKDRDDQMKLSRTSKE